VARVGVRELKAGLSEFLRRVQRGESITVTDRGRPVAVLRPIIDDTLSAALSAMVADGSANWSGGSPRFPTNPRPNKSEKLVSETILEERD
jgi:prevent-host-death family protein